MNKDRFNAGETLEVTATISISSPLLSAIEKIRANALLTLERLTFADGRPALAHGSPGSKAMTIKRIAVMLLAAVAAPASVVTMWHVTSAVGILATHRV